MGNDTYSNLQTDGQPFQSTFPRGERRRRTGRVIQILGISIHVPAWGTTVMDYMLTSVLAISIHVPAWGTTRTQATTIRSGTNFNPRSRVGNDCKPDNGANKTMISIHVPAWGTTLQLSLFLSACTYFNPRSRVGNDVSPDAR